MSVPAMMEIEFLTNAAVAPPKNLASENTSSGGRSSRVDLADPLSSK